MKVLSESLTGDWCCMPHCYHSLIGSSRPHEIPPFLLSVNRYLSERWLSRNLLLLLLVWEQLHSLDDVRASYPSWWRSTVAIPKRWRDPLRPNPEARTSFQHSPVDCHQLNLSTYAQWNTDLKRVEKYSSWKRYMRRKSGATTLVWTEHHAKLSLRGNICWDMPPHRRPSLLRDHLQSQQLHQLVCRQSAPSSMQLQSYFRIGQAQLEKPWLLTPYQPTKTLGCQIRLWETPYTEVLQWHKSAGWEIQPAWSPR